LIFSRTKLASSKKSISISESSLGVIIYLMVIFQRTKFF
jgi:hypothetical protein